MKVYRGSRICLRHLIVSGIAVEFSLGFSSYYLANDLSHLGKIIAEES